MQKFAIFCAAALTTVSQAVNAQQAETSNFEQHPIFTAQFILNQLGYDAGRVDGDYGPRTAAAISEFYQQTNLDDDDHAVVDNSDLLSLINVAEEAGLRTAPFSGFEHENSISEFLYPPISPAITRERYWFGHFWSNYDFNNDGLLDFIYTGTMNPENVEVTGEDTAGLCGGRDCEGDMPGPTLFLQDQNGAFIDRSDLFVDLRSVPGQSLARQNLVADFNGDDIPDLFIADHAIGHHEGIRDSYFLSQPDGTWFESSNTHLSDPSYQIFDHGGAVGDIDADGDVDIVLTELANKLTCWINDGSGSMSRRTCGDVNAFAIELGDMDGDGDLDLVHSGHEYGGSSPTGIALNDGRGNFIRSVRLPVVEDWGTVPELSLWDLDTDGDLDIVLSRAGILYVGTGVQVIENLGDGSYDSSFYPIVTAPAGYVAEHEGNEWNNFIENFRFHDVDLDGLVDVAFIGGGGDDQQNAPMVRGAYLKNLGGLAFSHIPANDSQNHVLRVPESLFGGSGAQGRILRNSDIPSGNIYAAAFDDFVSGYSSRPFSLDDFSILDAPIELPTSGAIITAMGNLEIHDRVLAGKYDVIIEWAGREFVATLCQEYYPQYDFLANRLVLGADQGFGGFDQLAQFATNSCAFYQGRVAVGAWEADPDISATGLDAVLSDLNSKEIGLELIVKMPMLTNEQRSEILTAVGGQLIDMLGNEQTIEVAEVNGQPSSEETSSSVLYTSSSDAVCSNGEPAAFHVYRTGSDQWFVYLQGGGLASNSEEYLSRIPTWTTPRTQPGYLQDMPAVEDFLNKGYNVAVIPYCSNDLYQGSHTHTIRGETVYFRGRAIVENVIEQLAPDLSTASRLVFGGSSAGAIGLGYNADLIAQFENPYLLVDSFWLDTESRAVRDSWSGPNWDAIEQFVYANMPEHCGSQWASCFPQRTHFDRYGFENVFFIWNMGDPYMRGDTNANRASIESDLAYYGQGLSIQNGEAIHPNYGDWVHGMLFNDFYGFPLEGGSLRERIWAWLN